MSTESIRKPVAIRINTGNPDFMRWRKSGGPSVRKGYFKAFTGGDSKFRFGVKKPAIPLFMRVCGLLKVAEREGFEPPEPFGSTVFKTAAIDRSAISPCVKDQSKRLELVEARILFSRK